MTKSSLEENDRLFAAFVRGHTSTTPTGDMRRILNYMFVPPIELKTDMVHTGRFWYRYQNLETSRTRWGMRSYNIPNNRTKAGREFTVYKNVIEGGAAGGLPVTWLEPVVVRVKRHEVESWIEKGTTPYPLLERFKKQAARQGIKIV